MPAAVVSPVMVSLRTKIIPAPRKPIPLTTCAAIRAPSAPRRPSAPIVVSLKPYFEIIIISAAPSATMQCVRTPASFDLRDRSIPIQIPQTLAPTIRRI